MGSIVFTCIFFKYYNERNWTRYRLFNLIHYVTQQFKNKRV